jgi:toxin ParE1/3/4
MPVIVKRPRAEADLLDIWSYIAEDSVSRADAFVDRIDQTPRTLAGQPRIGRARDELADHLRSFPIGRYLIFYFPLPGGVEVVRVLHAARDAVAIFDPEA